VSSRSSGRYSWNRATNSAPWTGSGRRPTGCWARPGSGGKKTGKNPTDRGKLGTKKSLLVEADGGPLAVVIAGANVNDHKLLEATIEAVVVERPDPAEREQHLSLDKGYDNPTGHEVVERHGYIGHIRPIGEDRREKRRPGRRKARRWVVERTLAWLSKCRALLVRYDKHDENYLGLIQLACGLLWYRRLYRLTAA
jgi:putative transposase